MQQVVAEISSDKQLPAHVKKLLAIFLCWLTMAEFLSVEYRALVKNTHKMISEISGDPLNVASRLIEKDLVASGSLGSMNSLAKEKALKASELVEQVNNKVSTFPEKFEVFIEILNELPWLRDLAKLLQDERVKIKAIEVVTNTIY